MKFEIEIDKQSFNKIKEQLINDGCDDDSTDEQYIIELFQFVGSNPYGEDIDYRDKVKVNGQKQKVI